jgi:hypothetical protein
MCGVGNAGTLFYQLSDHLFKDNLAQNSSTTAVVNITGDGSITAAEVQDQISRLCPNHRLWNWEAIPNGVNSFKISIPTMEDMSRLDGMEFRVKANKVMLSINASGSDSINPAFELHQVWVHVSGVPHELRHFWGLWGVGLMIGQTLDVDMISLRRRAQVRILVGIIDLSVFKDQAGDYAIVPSNFVVKLKGYELCYELEKEGYVPEMDFKPYMWKKPEDGEDPGADMAGGGGASDTHKRSKNNTTAPAQSSQLQGGAVPMNLASGRTGALPPSAEPGLLGAAPAARLLGATDGSTKAAAPADAARAVRPKPQVRASSAAATPSSSSAAPAQPSPSNPAVTQTSASSGSVPTQVKAGHAAVAGDFPPPAPVVDMAQAGTRNALGHGGGCLLPRSTEVLHGTEKQASGSAAQVHAAAGISCDSPNTPPAAAQTFSALESVSTPSTTSPVVTPLVHPSPAIQAVQTENGMADSPPLRRSARHHVAADGATPTDEDSLRRAMRLQASRNLDFSQGKISNKSYLAFPNERISSNLSSIGLGLGKNDKDILVSVKALKRIEYDRVVVTPKDILHLTDSELDDDEHEMAHDGVLLSHLVGDVSEVGLDECSQASMYDLMASSRKSKSQSRKKHKKPSKRARVTKSPTVSS